MKKYFLWFLALVCLAVTLVGCHSQPKPMSGKKPNVLVSIPPYISIASAIAGDTVDVHAAVSMGFDPHTNEITPNQAQMIQNCDLWIGTGEAYEKNLLASLTEAKQEVQVVQLNEMIQLLSYLEDVNFVDVCADVNHTDHSASDLHFWMSPLRLIYQAQVISDALIAMNPQHADLYAQNLANYIDKLKTLDAKITEQLKPFHKKGVIVSHPFLGYLCYDYNLYQISIECEGKSPRPQSVARVLQLAKSYDVQCVFTAPQFNNKGAILVAKKLNYKTYQVDPMQVDPLVTIQQVVNDITQTP